LSRQRGDKTTWASRLRAAVFFREYFPVPALNRAARAI
jgi:hypothetical protein